MNFWVLFLILNKISFLIGDLLTLQSTYSKNTDSNLRRAIALKQAMMVSILQHIQSLIGVKQITGAICNHNLKMDFLLSINLIGLNRVCGVLSPTLKG